jgi:AraC family transcriptional regulator
LDLSIKKFQFKEHVLRIDLGWARVELLRSAPYSIHDTSHLSLLGFAFERQIGIHTIGSSKRQDFDAWPGDLTYTAPFVDTYSESENGGEYLTLHIENNTLDNKFEVFSGESHAVIHGSRQAVRSGFRLRHSMLALQPDFLQIEENAAILLSQGMEFFKAPSSFLSRYKSDRKGHLLVMEYIDSAIDRPLNLRELASISGMPLLRFLRSFSSNTGYTPHAYVTERRLQRARTLLRSTRESPASIAIDCGFTHQSHLGAILKSHTGLSPNQYRVSQSKQ